MSLMVWHTLLSFYHLSEDSINVRSESKSDYKLTPDRLAELKNAGVSEATMNALEKEHKQAQKLGVWMCANCKKHGSQLANSKLKKCSKCQSIGRHVYYCSR
jgi:predicted Zn-ribbon and HTH transcriptional regulator